MIDNHCSLVIRQPWCLLSQPPRHEEAEGYETASGSRLKPDGQLLVSADFIRPKAQRLYTQESDSPYVTSSMVVPPFGFGVGHCLAIAKLIGKIVSELKDVRH